MTLTRLMATTVIATVALNASNRNTANEVTVCLGPESDTPTLAYAQDVTGRIFHRIGVSIKWKPLSHCPAGAIQITFRSAGHGDAVPDALAYALPYEGIHIVVFIDRVRDTGSGSFTRELLGHVMAHEIGHILESVSRHSETGVMKAHYEAADYQAMRIQPLAFTPEDVLLIELGVRSRSLSSAARGNSEAGNVASAGVH